MELQEEITSFVDNELKDRLLAVRLNKLIQVDSSIREEYLIQKSVKEIISSRLANHNAPRCPVIEMSRAILNRIKRTQ